MGDPIYKATLIYDTVTGNWNDVYTERHLIGIFSDSLKASGAGHRALVEFKYTGELDAPNPHVQLSVGYLDSMEPWQEFQTIWPWESVENFTPPMSEPFYMRLHMSRYPTRVEENGINNVLVNYVFNRVHKLNPNTRAVEYVGGSWGANDNRTVYRITRPAHWWGTLKLERYVTSLANHIRHGTPVRSTDLEGPAGTQLVSGCDIDTRADFKTQTKEDNFKVEVLIPTLAKYL